ncbi:MULTISPECIES: TetR family transcriptional regulator C-terminal domain-containing protein [unclassified Microbacterium]|uniref:TetR family transcriptional regulator C-terminal domain-containing protein n=1 Tax=unclassified Microbacterium TaxID=2609290 RepID=UPI000EA9481E|nr:MULTISPECIES: TetR family transcriptional regulator [unclassified Microbacterium]MBT2483868.1 TetR/AcrR family transcriptional regulator [Microbacterium sp. ISL-108]RKN66849.1 TetR/AcrR family transcriptional regulator [Microbacterium sp. CGR2]
MSDPTVLDGRRARGDASRRVVLHSATDLASVEGLDGLTIGRLAAASGHSKSSIATLFQGKEGLQLATVAAAREIFLAHVVEPARAHSRGAHRLAVLLRSALIYSRDRVFTGGCFFAATAADVDSKSGPVSDAVRTAMVEWHGYVEAQLRHAIPADELDVDDVEVLAFELVALYEEANSRSLLMGDERPYTLAAAAMRNRLHAAGARADVLALLEL